MMMMMVVFGGITGTLACHHVLPLLIGNRIHFRSSSPYKITPSLLVLVTHFDLGL